MEGLPTGLIVETDALSAASIWRREPYILFFPLGVALAWSGVLHWLLHALGVIPDYRPIFHAMTQVQGFMSCLAVGFLFTMIPRRTGSAPPTTIEITIGLLAPLTTTIAAWNQRWIIAQGAWLVLALTIVVFALRRFVGGGSRRRPPNAFVWIPLALLMGIAGSAMSVVGGNLGPEYAWLHSVASGLVLQGLFVGLILGVGSLALPLMTRDAAPPDGGTTARDWGARVANVVGAALLVASFWIEAATSLRSGMLLRAAVILCVFTFGSQLWRPPEREGWNARAIWAAAWMVPTGFLVAAAFPEQYRAGLHVTFVGGFALLGLLVSTQVTLGHGGFADLMLGKPWQIPTIGALMFAAMGCRAAMEFDPRRFFAWMAAAASLFLAATLTWALFLVPKFVARARNG